MLKELVSLANHLDSKGFGKEADALDSVILKYSSDYHDFGGPDEIYDGLAEAGLHKFQDQYYLDMMEKISEIVYSVSAWNAARITSVSEEDKAIVKEEILGSIGSSLDPLIKDTIKRIKELPRKKEDVDSDYQEDEELGAAWMPSGPGIL